MKCLKCITIILLIFFSFIQPEYSISQVNSLPGDTLDQNKTNVYKALGFTSMYYAGSLFILGKTWYKDRERVPFHFYNDNKGYYLYY